MKRFIFIIVLFFSAFAVEAQKIDSGTLKEMQNETKHLPRYKMFKTENSYILIKLDTRTGKAWMTQFRSLSTSNIEIPISYSGIEYESFSWNGRFEMYATNNIYKFIIVDTYLGDTYLLQWNSDENKRFVEKID